MNIKNEIIFISVFLSIFAGLLVILFEGCSQTQRLSIDISDTFYDCAQEDVPFSIYYIDRDSNFVVESVSARSEIGREITLEVSKNSLTPILIEFSNRDEHGFHPKTGFLYPITTDFSKAGAFCASVYFKLFLNSTDSRDQIRKFCSYFNWKRFYEKVCEYENPFVLDEELLCHDIASGNFSAYSFKIK